MSNEEDETKKLNYLALAKEAHSKFFVDQISQEEYVNLALKAWNDAYYGTAATTTTTADSENGGRNTMSTDGDGWISIDTVKKTDSYANNDDVTGQGEKEEEERFS